MFVSVYFLPDIFCELCRIGRYVFCVKQGATVLGFFFTHLKAFFFRSSNPESLQQDSSMSNSSEKRFMSQSSDKGTCRTYLLLQ